MYNNPKDQDIDIKINMSTNLKSEKDNDSTIGAPAYLGEPKADDKLLSEQGSPSINKKKTYKQGPIRWLALLFACCFLMGSYFCFDNPGPIEKTMEKHLDITQT